MNLSLEEAVALLHKWKDDVSPLLILGQNSSRWGLRAVHGGGVDWNMCLRGQVSQVSVSQGTISSELGTVVFEGLGGDLSLSMDTCAFSYDENCEAPPFVRENARARSSLFIFFPSNEIFAVYELEKA